MDNLIMIGSQQSRCTGSRSTGDLLMATVATLAPATSTAALVDVRPPSLFFAAGGAMSFAQVRGGHGIHVVDKSDAVYDGLVDTTDAATVGSGPWSPPI